MYWSNPSNEFLAFLLYPPVIYPGADVSHKLANATLLNEGLACKDYPLSNGTVNCGTPPPPVAKLNKSVTFSFK